MTDYERNKMEVNVTVSLQEKGGIYQAVLSYKDENDKWKTSWRSTGIRVKPGNKKLAKTRAEEIKSTFIEKIFKERKPIRKGIENQLDMEFVDFMYLRLEEVNVKRKYEYSTYSAYKTNIALHMTNYFGSSKRKDLKPKNPEGKIYIVEDITSDVIDSFFTYLSIECNLKNTSIKHLRNQISTAFEILDKKDIKRKPTIGIEHLKDEIYISQTYSMKELNHLLEIVKGKTIEIPVLLAAYYGLRRSEVIGLRWSAINFEEDTITINHTVVKTSGRVSANIDSKIVAKNRTKTPLSNRTLPLYPEIKNILLEKKERIELNKQIFKNCYNYTYENYVCVWDNGDIIDPDYITHKFKKIIRKNKLREIRYHDLRHTIATELNANGVDTFIIFGNCGVLDKSIEDCSIIIPNKAFRDEGTSYHYMTESDWVELNPKYTDVFKQILKENNYEFFEGATWTTDGFFRETREKVKYFKEQGAVCVEMEGACIAAVCKYRNLDYFTFYYAGDNMDAIEWDERSLNQLTNFEKKKLVPYLAFELARKISDIRGC